MDDDTYETSVLLNWMIHRRMLQFIQSHLLANMGDETYNPPVFDLHCNLGGHVEFTEKEKSTLITLRDRLGIKCESSNALLMALRKSNVTMGDVENDTCAAVSRVAREYLKLLGCFCLSSVPNEDAVDILVHAWLNIGMRCRPSCSIVMAIYEYHMVERSFPDNEQFHAFVENLEHIHDAPDEYCNNKRHHIPTPGIDNIEPYEIKTAGAACSICLEPIDVGAEVVQLPQCGHIFHACSEHCLGEGASILTWLRKSRYCPNCNTEISISPKRKKKETVDQGGGISVQDGITGQ